MSLELNEFFINNLKQMTLTERKVFNRCKTLESISSYALDMLLNKRITKQDYFHIDNLCRELM